MNDPEYNSWRLGMEQVEKCAEEMSISNATLSSTRSTLRGLGTTSGKGIMAVGAFAILLGDKATVQFRLRRAASTATNLEATVSDLETVLGDILEYQRMGLYPVRVQEKAWQVLMTFMKRKDFAHRLLPIWAGALFSESDRLVWSRGDTYLPLEKMFVCAKHDWIFLPSRPLRPEEALPSEDDQNTLTTSFLRIVHIAVQRDPPLVNERLSSTEFAQLLRPFIMNTANSLTLNSEMRCIKCSEPVSHHNDPLDHFLEQGGQRWIVDMLSSFLQLHPTLKSSIALSAPILAHSDHIVFASDERCIVEALRHNPRSTYWFYSRPLEASIVQRIKAIQLFTHGHSMSFEGWRSVDMTVRTAVAWFELHILRFTQTGIRAVAADAKSHDAQMLSALLPGARFTMKHALLQSIQAGDIIAVRFRATDDRVYKDQKNFCTAEMGQVIVHLSK